MAEEMTRSQEQIFQDFMAGNEQIQSVAIAKQLDKIKNLQEEIVKIQNNKQNEQQTIKVMDTFVKNNAFPFLNPVAKAMSNQMDNALKSGDKKIERAEKKIKKAQRKLKKLRIKQQIGKAISALIHSLKNSDNKQIAYTNGIQALQQSSLLNAIMKFDNINEKLANLDEKLKNSDITEVQKTNIQKKVENLTGQKKTMEDKIAKLQGLGQSLSEFSEISLSEEKSEELAQSAINTAEQSAVQNKSLFEIMDNLTNQASQNVNAVLNPQSAQVQEQNQVQAEVQVNANDWAKKSNLTKTQVAKLASSGIPLQVIKNNDKFSVIYEKSQSERVNEVLEKMKIKKFDFNSVLKPVGSDNENIVGKTMTPSQAKALFEAGIKIEGGHQTAVMGQFTIYISKSDEAKADKILSETSKKYYQSQTAKPKR